MSWLTIATLIAQYGLPFVEHLIKNAENNTPVNPAEWATLKTKINTSFDDIKVGP